MIKKHLFRTNKQVTIDPLLTGYGRLFNPWAVTDVKNIAAPGWRVASVADYENLIGIVSSGLELKESGTSHWTTNNGTDTIGFNARGGGQRTTTFSGLKSIATFWCSDGIHIVKLLDNGTITIEEGTIYGGHSVRLVRDDSGNGDGDTGVYHQNDGAIVQTITINGQEWTMNIRETKFRTGASIQNIIDDEIWVSTVEIPSLYEIYQGGILFQVSLDGKTGYVLNDADLSRDTGQYNGIDEAFSWQQAIDFVAGLTLEGYSDWYLGTKAMWTKISQVLIGPYPDLQIWYYWTSEELDEFYAWFADPSSGNIEPAWKGSLTRLRAVRTVSIPEPAAQCIYNNDPGIIVDIEGIVTFLGESLTQSGELITFTTTSMELSAALAQVNANLLQGHESAAFDAEALNTVTIPGGDFTPPLTKKPIGIFVFDADENPIDVNIPVATLNTGVYDITIEFTDAYVGATAQAICKI